MRKVIISATAACLVASPAMAGDKMYAWKAGVTPDTYDADQQRCLDAAKVAMKDPTAPNPYINPVTNGTAAGRAGSALASGMALGLMQGKAFKATYYGCLAQAGYSQRRWPSAEYKAFKKLSPEDKKARLQALALGREPLHPEMPIDEYD
jgi:hypothetical protein